MITVAALIACGIAPTQAKIFDGALAYACDRFGITSTAQKAQFLAQCAHESAGFTRLEESLYYTTPERIATMWPMRVSGAFDAASLCRNPQALANRVYANRIGNGDETSGDGWRYRGRGLIQLTGRENYERASEEIGEDYSGTPELVAQPAHAALTAAWFFVSRGCLLVADDVAAVTRIINGRGMVGLDDRRQWFEQAAQAFA